MRKLIPILLAIMILAALVAYGKSGYAVNKDPENIQRLVINERDIKVEIVLNQTYYPGDKIRADFYITNKRGTVNRIDIKLDVYYFGFKIFSYQHPSWREYEAGKTVHIFYESRLPLITPPGKYLLKFYMTPKHRETKMVTTPIVVLPNVLWILSSSGMLALVAEILIMVRQHWDFVSKKYRELAPGQSFVLVALIVLMTLPVALLLNVKNYAVKASLLVYYLLLVGMLNIWIEHFKFAWDNKNVRAVLSLYLLAFFAYLSRDEFTPYFSMLVFILGTLVLAWHALSRGREGSG